MMHTTKTWLTGDEACRQFGISQETLDELRANGDLQGPRFGRKIVFERAVLEDRLRNRLIVPSLQRPRRHPRRFRHALRTLLLGRLMRSSASRWRGFAITNAIPAQ